jgi:predicted transcriptional regulator
VELSAALPVELLYRQGKSVSDIATSLALPTKIVNSYLNITETTEAALLSAELKKGS